MVRRCLSVGLLSIRVRYLLARPEGYYYQRKIPRDLQRHYDKSHLRFALGTKDAKEAIRVIQRLNSKHEADWRALRHEELQSPQVGSTLSLNAVPDVDFVWSQASDGQASSLSLIHI